MTPAPHPRGHASRVRRSHAAWALLFVGATLASQHFYSTAIVSSAPAPVHEVHRVAQEFAARSSSSSNSNNPAGAAVPSRFAGIEFPRACSMRHALDGMQMARPFGGGNEFLPEVDFSGCQTPPGAHDAVFAGLFGGAPGGTFDWHGGTTGKPITMGKYMGWASLDLEKHVHKAHAEGPPTPALLLPENERWARHLDCTTKDAWACMFGRTTPSTTAADKGEMEAAKLLWSQRPCIFDEACGDTQSEYISDLLHGWMLRWAEPMNACSHGYRNGCSNRVTSNVNLPKSTTNRVFLSIHMRMGDACDVVEYEERKTPWVWKSGTTGRPCIAPVGYDDAVRRMTAKYGVTDILLASDSPEAIAWAKNQTRHDVHWLVSDRSKLGQAVAQEKGRKRWIEHRTDITAEEIGGALEEIDFLAHGQVFIGNMGSYFSRAIWRHMVGRQNVQVPWVAVDGAALKRRWATVASYTKQYNPYAQGIGFERKVKVL